ncbi:MAG: NUDIX hydrolase [Lachnospiraceae bacterium]|nr:NUDIX hydrolase [Lachnospiraceae bacterium]
MKKKTVDAGSQTEQSLEWEEIKTEHLVQDEWIDFRRSAFRFPDGTVFEPFYSYSRRDYVVIVATDEAGNAICVRQYRQGIHEVTTEFPAGGIERRDGKEYAGPGRQGEEPSEDMEDTLEAAKRELREETGYESAQWRFLLRVPANATIADNYAYLFEAKNCRKVSGQELDETEFLNVRLHTPDEIEELIRTNRFQQGDHILGWLLSRREG